MAYRHVLPARLTLDGDQTVAARYVGEARVLLGALMEELGETNIRSGKRRRERKDVIIEVAYDGTLPSIRIRVPTPSSAGVVTDTELWLPQGFVVYPASDDAPAGWGAPVVQDVSGGATIYSPQNLAPGLDTARWTVGGALGQVLLSQVARAGYPAKKESLIPPLYFLNDTGLHPAKGVPAADLTGTWAAYRIEFVNFTAQSPDAGAGEQAFVVTQKQLAYDAVNAHRVSIGRDPLLLPIRGFYDSAQATAEVMSASHTLGHFAAQFPVTYRTYPDRIEKDGFTSYVKLDESSSRNKPSGGGGENAVANALSTTLIGTDPNGSNILDIVPGADISSSEAVAAWLASPEHLANIESTVYDKAFTSTFLGFKRAFAIQEFVHRTQWVSCGNRTWQSMHAEIPVISWFGFQSLNLAWETWPAAMDNSSPTTPPSDPLIILTNLVDSGDGLFWLRYRFASEGANNATFDYRNAAVPALDGRLFCRGRAFAVAPNGGLIWAAAVQKYESPDSDADNRYRVIILAHHEADQPSDQKTNGMTRYLRVWWCDLPNDSAVPFNPHSTIRGVYGDEDEGWPWDVTNSPYSWRGGTLLDVANSGSSVDRLKYAAQWVFNAAGTEAVCLRDAGEYADFADLYVGASQGSVSVPNGTVPCEVRMTLSNDLFSDLTATLSFAALPTGATPQNFDVGDPSGPWHVITYPIAVGYSAGDVRTYCAKTMLVNPFNVNPNEPSRYYQSFSFVTNYDYAPSDYHVGTRFSSAVARDDNGRLPYCHEPSVLDIRDQVIAAFGVIQFYEFDGTVQRANPDFEACWNGTSNPVCKVTFYRAGAALSTREFANPDGTVFSLFAFCYQTSPAGSHLWIGTQLPLSQNSMLLASYARSGTDWFASYVVQPQASMLYRITSGSSDCDIYTDLDMSCAPTPSSTLTTLLEGDASCRGGWMQASFADEAALADLMQIPGSHPRVLYARAA